MFKKIPQNFKSCSRFTLPTDSKLHWITFILRTNSEVALGADHTKIEWPHNSRKYVVIQSAVKLNRMFRRNRFIMKTFINSFITFNR